MACGDSTARHSMNMRIRVRASIPTGARMIFNYGRNEVRNFLVSNALFWLDKYHIDGLRVDAVASMLYLDYSREEGEWIPNEYGGRENLAAISLLKEFNEVTHGNYPGVLTIAEESTAWGGVSHPTFTGGLGFSIKWNMGWMNDTLRYMRLDPIHRNHHHNDLTFSLIYAFTENFALPLSHDEVVHGKVLLLGQMSGDLWQKFANLRLLYSYMWTHPGKKLLFMGSDIGQWNEWNHEADLQWDLLQWDTHSGIQKLVADLNALYRREPALYEQDFDGNGFEWIDCHSSNDSVLVYIRKARDPRDYADRLLQLHARRPTQLSRRPAVRRLVPGSLQQRLALLRRQQRRKLPWRECRRDGTPWSPPLDAGQSAPLGRRRLQAPAVMG